MHPCEEKKDGCKEFLTLPRMNPSENTEKKAFFMTELLYIPGVECTRLNCLIYLYNIIVGQPLERLQKS